MSPAQLLRQLKSGEIKIYSDNLHHCTNWSTEMVHCRIEIETLKNFIGANPAGCVGEKKKKKVTGIIRNH